MFNYTQATESTPKQPLAHNMYLGDKTLITMTDMEGNLIQALIYLDRLNQDRSANGLSTVNIFIPETMREHLSATLAPSPEEIQSNLQLLILAINNPRGSYLAFSEGEMSLWLEEIRLEIPADIHMVFNGDFLDATSHPAPNVQRGIVHHQILLSNILINTKNRYAAQVTLILGNRDINKVRDDFITDPATITANTRELVENISEAAFQQFKAASDTSDNAIKKFWYDHVTKPMFETKLVWASQNPGDFFIYRGMIAIIKTALQNSECDLISFKEAINAKLSEAYLPEDYLKYIYANTLGAPKALESFTNELTAYSSNESLTLDVFLERISPLYVSLIERGQLMQRVILNDGSSVLFVHGHFSKKVLQCAEELKSKFAEFLGQIPLDITDLDSVVNFYNQFAIIALANPGADLWKKLQLIGFMGDPGSIITEPYTKFNDGTPVSEYPEVEAKYATAYQQLVANAHLKVINVGHLPQNGTSVFRDESTNVLIFANDNGKGGYSLSALNSDGSQTIYVAKSYSELLTGNIARRDFLPIARLAGEVQELGMVVKFTDSADIAGRVNPSNDATVSALLSGAWRVDAIDSERNLITLSQNTGPENGFKNASISIDRSVFIDHMYFVTNTPLNIQAEKSRATVVSVTGVSATLYGLPTHPATAVVPSAPPVGPS